MQQGESSTAGLHHLNQLAADLSKTASFSELRVIGVLA
jgi:hypothetical protein